MPARWHQQYIKDLYRENLMVQPGALTVCGVPIDLKTVKTPTFIQAGKEDHIAPAKSAFKLTKAFSGETRFVLAGSGHIAGVVNPPSAMKYQHWIGDPTVATRRFHRQRHGNQRQLVAPLAHLAHAAFGQTGETTRAG